jgi:hypothetical protein
MAEVTDLELRIMNLLSQSNGNLSKLFENASRLKSELAHPVGADIGECGVGMTKFLDSEYPEAYTSFLGRIYSDQLESVSGGVYDLFVNAYLRKSPADANVVDDERRLYGDAIEAMKGEGRHERVEMLIGIGEPREFDFKDSPEAATIRTFNEEYYPGWPLDENGRLK